VKLIVSLQSATHELCANLDNLIELTKESRAPIRALSFIERAREDLQAYLDEIERTSSAPQPGRDRGLRRRRNFRKKQHVLNFIELHYDTGHAIIINVNRIIS
jgi:hypothetical protein